MKRELSLLLLIISAISLYGQKLVKEGFTVRSDKDTIYGKIYPEDEIKMMQGISFKAEGSEKTSVLLPGPGVSAFYSDNYYFESLELEGEMVFLRCLVDGYYSLFRYPGPLSEGGFYIRNQTGELILLNNTFNIREIDGTSYNKPNLEYIATLKIMMQEHPELYEQINACELKEPDLVALISRYNGIIGGPESVVFYKKPAPKFNIGIMAGVSKFMNSSSVPGIHGGALLSIRPPKETSRARYNFGIYYNNAVPCEKKEGQFALEFPIYFSYYVINLRPVNLAVDFGVVPALWRDDSYYYIILMLGLSMDVQVGERYIKLRGAYEGGFLTLGAGYFF